MRAQQLVETYPRLFHMAWEGSWPSIREHGLLSTRALLELYEVEEQVAQKIVGEHRPHWIEIKKDGFPGAVVRDQKPMSDEGVRRALGSDVCLRDWYSLLNSMVFFWPTKKRLITMMKAGAYRGMRHDLIIIDTERLVRFREEHIRLSAMNSGATKPFPHPRSMDMFMTLADFPFDERMNRHKAEGAVAEVCVEYGVEEVEACALEVRTVSVSDALEIV